MQDYIGYIRVSTIKQGTQGVSLLEQRDGIARFGERREMKVGLWLEEMETAAKRGRPMFNQALKLLRQGKYRGLILHKLDRGARNLKDWAEIGELSDQGIEVHFVNEDIDLHTRGGRLSADIQAVVSADYIRNLREETRKGFYGRLKQGFYPLPAPIGYLNHGKAQFKTIDPVRGPLVRKAFELYATGRHNLETLGEEMHRLGLRNQRGGRVTRTGLSTLLNNSFYIGLIHLRRTGETFSGGHEPLIRKGVFERVQAVLEGRVSERSQHHAFAYRRLLSCSGCGYSLIGERQKGHVYYRCHSKPCAGTSLREETVETGVQDFLQSLDFPDPARKYFKDKLEQLRQEWTTKEQSELRSLELRRAQIDERLNRLTDAYLDQALDKTMFEARKQSLLVEKKEVEEQLAGLASPERPQLDRVEIFLELTKDAQLSYELAFPEEKREMVEIATSNRKVLGKKLELEPSLAFQAIVNPRKSTNGAPMRDEPRMLDQIIERLVGLTMSGNLPDLSTFSGFAQRKGENKRETG